MSAQLDLGPRRDPALDDPVVDLLPEPPSSTIETRLSRGVEQLARILLYAGIILTIGLACIAWGFFALIVLVIFGLAQDTGPGGQRD